MTAKRPGNKGLAYWVKRISDEDMPALCSTLGQLEQLAADDVSSLSQLGRSVMHDNALTSRILRVANSVTYNKGRHQIATVSRAAVVLGFDTLRNICLTARLISSLLESKHLSSTVYPILVKRMATSFQAAMLARMMQHGQDEQLEEEVFVAALLHHLGESAFWSIGGDDANELQCRLHCEPQAESRLIRSVLGGSFAQLTQLLASHWGLGELLVKSLAQPPKADIATRSICLANMLSDALADGDVEQIAALNQQAAQMLGMPVSEFQHRVQRCTKATVKLAQAYDAPQLCDVLVAQSEMIQATQTQTQTQTQPQPQQSAVKISGTERDESIQLRQLRLLTTLAEQQADFIQVVQATLVGLKQGVGLDRCGVFLISQDRQSLSVRMMQGDDNPFSGRFELQHFPLLATAIRQQQIINIMPGEMMLPPFSRVAAGGFILAPLVVEEQVIGLFYADRQDADRPLTEQQQNDFIHFARQANQCFALAARQSISSCVANKF